MRWSLLFEMAGHTPDSRVCFVHPRRFHDNASFCRSFRDATRIRAGSNWIKNISNSFTSALPSLQKDNRNWEETMLAKFAAALLAIALSAGPVHALTGRSHSLSFAHFPTCSEGLVKAICVCRATDGSRRFGLCRSGRHCHTLDGACTR